MKKEAANRAKPNIEIRITASRLKNLAHCAYRMIDYADPNDSLLITNLRSKNGKPIRLVLDKRCFNRSPPLNINSQDHKQKIWRLKNEEKN